MNPKLKEKIKESLSAVLPITLIVLVISILLVPMELGTIVMFLVGAIMLIVGMGFFQLGAETAMTPLGEGVGVQMSKSKHIGTVVILALLMGMIITIAEPDLQVLADQVPAIPNNVLIFTVAVGVGIFLVVAILRIMKKISLSALLIGLYVLLIGLSFFVPDNFLAVAFDAGGVTTGPITVPFIMALGVGLSSIRSDKDAASDSFGLVALCSIGPILAVMILGLFYNPQEAVYTATEVASVATTQDVTREFLMELPHYAKDVMLSLLPIVGVFVLLQLVSKRFQKRQCARIIVGMVYTFIGLALFLCGVSVGFAPVGTLLGAELASSGFKWLLVPIGMLIGYFIVKAEPAIQVLNTQVEDVTNGAISAAAMNRCLSIGVAAAVGLAMVRVLTGISLYYIIIPGYLIALILSRLVPKIFVGIAFDSGGVASGPMTSTFLLPLCIGACSALGGNVMTDAFGVVALVALTPLIAVQIMGLIYKYKTKGAAAVEETIETMEEEIIDMTDEIVELEESAELIETADVSDMEIPTAMNAADTSNILDAVAEAEEAGI
ncbi:DUF1538 domain-containing protein [Christensenellaceae bacterium OttesenSCG-928-M15]|nr:DUF1538 domain-containing protein [Christensenellaceae bacterium OttesenSCG-928-M15]